MSERIKILTEMLFENMELLESYDSRVKAYRDGKQAWLLKYPDREAWEFNEQFPCVGTSKANIKNIATLIRKELLKI